MLRRDKGKNEKFLVRRKDKVRRLKKLINVALKYLKIMVAEKLETSL